MSNGTNKKPHAKVKSGAVGNGAQKGQKGFPKGISGHPEGRPKGSRNWATRIAAKMVEGAAETVIGGLIEKANNGHFQAQKFLAERLLPPMRSRALSIPLPAIETPADIVKAIDQIWSAVGAGAITLDEAHQLLGILEFKRKAIETADLAAEIEQIKEHMEIEK